MFINRSFHFHGILSIICILLILQINENKAQNPKCYNYQFINPGNSSSIQNAEYPNKSRGPVNCLWKAETNTTAKLVLNCEVINLPTLLPQCRGQRLEIDTNPGSNATIQNFCGTGSVSVASMENSLTVRLVRALFGQSGKFHCTVKATNETSN